MRTLSINEQVAIQNHIAAHGVTVCPTMFAAGYKGQAAMTIAQDGYRPEPKTTDEQTIAELFNEPTRCTQSWSNSKQLKGVGNHATHP